MFAQMMYWRELDQTPWTKYVPSWYFKDAEALLDDLEENGGRPERWNKLPAPSLDDARELNKALFEDVGSNDADDDLDEDFDPKALDSGSGRRTTTPRAAKRRHSVTSDSGCPQRVHPGRSRLRRPRNVGLRKNARRPWNRPRASRTTSRTCPFRT
jgi:hypothetical protein